MKALVWEGPKDMTMRDWPEPVAAKGEVVIRVAFAGICGSELGGYLVHNAPRVPPLVIGHEFSGIVTAVAERAATDLAPGDAVTCNPMVPCGACAFRAEGLLHLCANRSLIGAYRPGVMIELFAVGIRIGRQAGDVAGRPVLVIGAGPIGLLALQMLMAGGATEVFVADLDPERRAMAAELGGTAIDPAATPTVARVRAATGGLGVPLTVDAVGSAGTRAEAVAATRSGGRCCCRACMPRPATFPPPRSSAARSP